MTDPRLYSFDELLVNYGTERGSKAGEPLRLGFGSLDADLRGVSPGQVLGIAARTAVGKTWLLNSIAHNLSRKPGTGTLIASLEMPGLEWAERQLAIHQDVAPEVVEGWAKQGKVGENATEFLEQMRDTLILEDPIRLEQLHGVCATARGRLSKDAVLQAVIVDYFGLLITLGRDAYERSSSIARDLKQFAKKEHVAVFVAMQVSRAGGDGSEPITLDMLRDSGVLEEAADFVLGCWRPGKAKNLTVEERAGLRDTLRVSVLKNRKGVDGREVDLRFRPESRRLYEEADPFAALAPF